MRRLQQAGFRLNKEKCEFFQPEIKFLGHTFRELKAEINIETRTAIRNFERSRNKKGVQAFLGLINWDRRFVKNLSRLTQPLEDLLKKRRKFEWKEDQKAFDEIKREFDEATKLFLIRPEYKFGIATDAAMDLEG